ncbi:MAG: hypothetical protein SFV54_14430 [Bryobacteraceae bacterium]|nr:hypothetical protein [Bryobacteraceae bacterium]
MLSVRPRPRGLSRRGVLAALSSVPLFGQTPSRRGQELRPETLKYNDAATEFPLERLTNPQYESYLPPHPCRIFGRRGDSVLVASRRSGTLQAFQIEQKRGEWRQLTEARELDARSLSLLPDDRVLCYADGASILISRIGGAGRDREVYRTPDGWRREPGLAISEDGLYAFVAESREDRGRLQLVGLAKGTAATIFEGKDRVMDVVPRPRRAGVMYRRSGDGGLYLTDFEGKQNYRLQLAEKGRAGTAVWAADGRTLFYLHFPEERGKLNSIREFIPDEHTDTLVAPTTQFVAFNRNSDGTVFVGASGSKASPHVLLVLRVTKRELTLCEHRALEPASSAPCFNPSNERVYFQSDREGKPAIYAMVVEKLVEKSEA